MSSSDEALEEEIFEYLDELRLFGVMYGATEHVQEQFDLDRKTAGKFVSNWMKSYSERHSA